MLLVEHAGALIGEALIAAAVTQLLGAAERVTVCGVLAELRPLQAVLLVEPNIVKRLAVPVGGRLRLPACRRLQGRATNQIKKKMQPSDNVDERKRKEGKTLRRAAEATATDENCFLLSNKARWTFPHVACITE